MGPLSRLVSGPVNRRDVAVFCLTNHPKTNTRQPIEEFAGSGCAGSQRSRRTPPSLRTSTRAARTSGPSPP
eukprot:3334852-Rhodomonas_salina.1